MYRSHNSAKAITFFCGALLLLSCSKHQTLTETTDTRSDVSIIARKWALLDSNLSGKPSTLQVNVTAPVAITELQVALDGEKPMLVSRAANATQFSINLPIDGTRIGSRKILVAEKNSGSSIAVANVNISHPLLVVVSTDWDDSRFDHTFDQRMVNLHVNHPSLKVTHFFAPYHFTDPQVSPARKLELVNWVQQQRTTFGDEIGLHLHGWCHFINTTGVQCRTKETFYRDDGSGYTTIIASYSRSELTTIIQKSLEVFAANNLGRPRSFRSGGWTANATTLQALADTGFEIDSSAVPPNFISSWKGAPLYDWLVQNWTGILPTSQPYIPSRSQPTKSAQDDAIPLLEVPDNGALVDYMKARDMIAVLEQNQPGNTPLAAPTLFQVGYHPPSFSIAFYNELNTTLAAVDNRLYKNDTGPAVYVNISDLKKFWK
jgi:hypothetical protein